MVVSILVLALLLALSAFFSSSETILFSLTPASRMRIRERDAAADRFIGKCLDDSAALLSTLLVLQASFCDSTLTRLRPLILSSPTTSSCSWIKIVRRLLWKAF